MSASPSPISLSEDDALSLVQAQYEVSGVIFSSENPVDVLRGFHRFTGDQFSSAHLAHAYGEQSPVTLQIVAEGSARALQTANRRASLNDYPAVDTLAALNMVYIPDLRTDTTLTDAERDGLRSRAVRAALVIPLVAHGHISGLIAMTHDESVSLSPARLRALNSLADQLAVVIENRRLLKAAQATASQEQTINALVARFQTATSADELLRMTLTELGRSLGAVGGAVRLATDSETGTVPHA